MIYFATTCMDTRLLLTILLGLSFLRASAQNFDTTLVEVDWQHYQTASRMEEMNFDDLQEDTQMWRPHMVVPGLENRVGWLDQGGYLSPMYSTEYHLRTGTHLELVPNPLESSYLKPDSIRFYSGKVPRTNLKYAQGTGNLIHLKAEHDQQVGKGLSVGLNYQRNKIQNLFYDNLPQFDEERMSNGYGLQLYSRFKTANLKYEAMADYTWNKYIIQETGGVVDFNRMDTLTGRQRQYSNSAELSDAENLFKQRSFTLRQFFRDGPRTIRSGDSLVTDTTYTAVQGQWLHIFKYTSVSNRFEDNGYNEEIYPNRYLSLTTTDSAHLTSVNNQVYRIQRIQQGVLKVGMDYEVGQLKQINGYQLDLSNLRLAGSYSSAVAKISLNVALAGYYAGDALATGEVRAIQTTDRKADLRLIGVYSKRRPSFNEQFFLSNYLTWNRSMSSMEQTRLEGRINLFNQVVISAAYNTVMNMVYVDSSGMPQQLDELVGIPQLKVEVCSLALGKLRFRMYSMYQPITQPELHLPDLIAYANLYVEGKLFKKNMFARMGVDAYYTSSFDGVWYDPSSRLFRNTSQTAGGYPLLNAYLNMHVKTMQLFVVGEHLLQGTTSNDWQSLPGYPMRARSLRLGAVWRLFD